MILNQFGYSLTFRRNIKYKALAFLSSPVVFVLKQNTHAHGQMITASGNEIAWGHATRKAVNTLKLIITEAICLRSAGYVLFCSWVASFHVLSRMGTQDNNFLYLLLNFLSFRQDIGQISTWKVVINVKNKSITKNLTI